MMKYISILTLFLLFLGVLLGCASKFTVTFEGESLSYEKLIVTDGDMLGKLPTPERLNFIFDGWYSDENFLNEVSETTRISSDTTIYAKWVPSSTLSFDSNFGSMIPDEAVKKGSQISNSDLPTPVRDGFKFDGWYIDELLTEPIGSIASIDTDLVLYALWTPSMKTFSDILIDYFIENGSIYSFYSYVSSYYTLDNDIFDTALVPSGFSVPSFDYNYEDDYIYIFMRKEAENRDYGDFIAIEAYILLGDYDTLDYDVYGDGAVITARTNSIYLGGSNATLGNFTVTNGKLTNFGYEGYIHYGYEDVKQGFIDDTYETFNHVIFLLNTFAIEEFGFAIFPNT